MTPDRKSLPELFGSVKLSTEDPDGDGRLKVATVKMDQDVPVQETGIVSEW